MGTLSSPDPQLIPVSATVCLVLPGVTSGCSGSTPPAGPAISSFSPPSAIAGGLAFTLTVNGSNFASGAVVQWNGTALPTHFVSSTQLTATVGATMIASAGTVSITVTSGGQTSASMPFTINPPSGGSTPTITSLVPNVVLVADDGSLACYPGQGAGGGICFAPSGSYQFGFSVDGTNFTSSSAIQWNGSAISTTYVSATEVDGSVPGSFLTSPGTVPITVSSGGQTSAAAPFTVTNFAFQTVTTQAPPTDGSCVAPPPVTSFVTTDNTVYLYFFGIVTASDSLEADWIAPDGTVSTVGPWPSATGVHCLDSRNLSIGSLPASRLGSWQVRVSNKGKVLFSVPFTVSTPGAPNGPSITTVSNAASYAAGGIAPGEIVYIAGSIAPGVSGVISASGSFGTQLAGASIQFNGVAAPLIYVSAAAAAAIVPYEVSGPTAQVTVTYQGQTSAPFQVPVLASIPGLFTANSSGTGEVAALNQDSSINSSSNPAAPGSIVTLFATGEGQTSPAGVDGKLAAAPLPKPLLPVSVTMGSIGAYVAYAGGAPGEVAGVMQVNAQLPAGVTGPAVPVLLIVGSATSQIGATIAVQGASSTGPPANIQILSGNAQTTPANQAFSAPLVVKVVDSQGNPLSGAPLTWTVSQGSAILSNSSASTDAGGQGSTNVTAGPAAGAVVIAVTAGSATAVLTLSVTAGGSTSVSVYSSGQNVTNGRDNSYQIVADTTGEIAAPAAAFVVTSLAGGWTTIPGAAWIAPSADQSNATRNPCCANTSDRYRTTFTVSGSPSSAALNLTIAADDYVDVLLNGNSVFTHPNTAMWGTPVPFSITSGFVSGTNTLDFLVTNASGPTGLIVAVTSAASGLTQVTPGQTLTISGNFNTATSVTTTVVFSDNAGFNMSLTPLSVASGSVSVLVPPYFNTQEGLVTSGAVTVSVVQQPASGPSTTTPPQTIQVAALPATGVAPGTITLAVLSQLIQSVGIANQTWATIQQESGGLVQSSNLNLTTMQSNLSTMQSQIQALVSGTITQACMGQLNGQNICLTTSGLALLDQLYYAFYLGSTTAPAQVSAALSRFSKAHPEDATDLVDNLQSWYNNLTTSTLPETIRSNASTLRTIVDISVALGTLAFGAEIVTGVAIAAVANMAITWVSAAECAALEGAGTEIQSGDTSDFTNTIGVIEDSQEEPTTLNGALASLVEQEAGAVLGEAAQAVAEIAVGVESLLNPEDPNSDASEAETASAEGLLGPNLVNAGYPLNGSWTGDYSRTPSSGCGTYSGPMTMSTTEYSDGSVSGTFTMMNLKFYDSSCNVTQTGNITTGGNVGAQSAGADASGHAEFTGTLTWSLDNSLTFGNFPFTLTVVNGSINGVFANNAGTFTLH